MGKADKNNAKNVIAQQQPVVQGGIDTLRGQNQDRNSLFQGLYNQGTQQNMADYGSTMGGYQNFMGRNGPLGNTSALSGFAGNYSGMGAGRIGADQFGAIAPSVAGYKNFADTGGFSPTAIGDIRARATAPVNATGEMLSRRIAQQNAIRGSGYSPNTTAALAKTARDTSYSAGDIATNAEAGLQQQIQQGKLAGLGGLSNIGLESRGQDITQRGQDLAQQLGLRGQDLSSILGLGQQELATRGLDLSALGGMTGLYGTRPGMSETFGNQVLGNAGQGIQVQGLQGQFSQEQIDNAMKLGQMKGIPWKQILATTAGAIAIAATGGTAAPYVVPAVAGTYKEGQ